MQHRIWFIVSIVVTLSFVSLLVFVLNYPALPFRLAIAALVAVGSVAAAYKRLMRKSSRN